VDELMEQTELPESAAIVDFYMHLLDCLSPLGISKFISYRFLSWLDGISFLFKSVNAHNISCSMYRKKKKIDIRSPPIA
jgi:hypothetical protein